MAERTSGSPLQLRVGQVQRIRAPDRTADIEGLRVASDALFGMSLKVQDALDDEARIDGARRGMRLEKDDSLLFAPTLRGEAYTQAYAKAFATEVDRRARVRFDELSVQHANDPAGLQQSLAEATDSLLEGVAPEFSRELKGHLSDLGRPLVAQARKGMLSAQAAQVRAEAELANRELALQAERYAAGVLDTDPEVRAASVQALSRMRAMLESQYGATITDDRGLQVPVYTAEDKAKALLSWEDTINVGAIKGWFDSQPDKLGAMRRWYRGEAVAPVLDASGNVLGTFNPASRMDVAERDRITQWMRSSISSDLSIEAQIQAREDRRRERADKAMMMNILRLEDPVERAQSLQVVKYLTSDPQTAQWAEKTFGELGFRGPTDPGVMDIVLRDIADGTIRHPVHLPEQGLSQDDRNQLSRMLLSRASQNHVTNTLQYKDAVDLLYLEVTGSNRDGYLARLSGGTAQQNARVARLELQLLRAALDADPTTFSPRTVAEALLADRKQNQADVAEAERAAKAALDAVTQRRIELRAKGVTSEAALRRDERYQRLVDDSRIAREQLEELRRAQH